MKGWIIVGILAVMIYYLATQTRHLDGPIAQTQTLLQRAKNKLDAMTGTHIIKAEHKLSTLKNSIADRLSSRERQEFEQILVSPQAAAAFKDEFCNMRTLSHPIFSKDNLQLICDKL
ncbi:hypothetical protein LZP73_18195 [Shewanella sp. AS16]|uniref:hypothetical protein n=1 Tax=Shewanella sp. AS16 TaxID=2907625 RepID=UPI001F2B3881|nr:hypothetical protein [Shewanella sp. AS16]MCE9688112.1 hypothetical protein [Shewanella sp. AS16]